MPIVLDGLLAVASALCLAVVATALYAWGGLPPALPGIVALVFVPALVAVIGGILIWRGQRGSKAVFVWCLISSAIGAYAAEAYIGFLSSKEDARIGGRIASTREEISTVVARYRSAGVDVYPVLTPRTFLSPDSYARLQKGMPADSGSPFPLGGISNVKTVFCDEGGGMIAYDADEHGFRNPRGLWEQAPVDVVLVGDSYVHGACVEDAATFAATIRKKFPVTINLGMAGNGPIVNLAALREFGPHLKPRVVVWFFTVDNDFADLAGEISHPTLRRYLAGNIEQALFSRQTAVDRALRGYIASAIVETTNVAEPVRTDLPPAGGALQLGLAQRVKAFMTLNRVRNALGISFSEPGHDYRMLRSVLAAAQKLAASWDGKMLFVFLPSSNSYVGFGRFDRTVLIVRNRLRELTDEMGIVFIDGQKVFDAASHDEALFYGLGSHYTPKGQRLIGAAIRESLSQIR